MSNTSSSEGSPRRFSFATLDPRDPNKVPAAKQANDTVFAAGPVLGIEVTVRDLIARCTGNLDPQHSGGDANRAAIEDALTAELPMDGTTLATVRPDLDAVGAMAIFSMRARNIDFTPDAMTRITMVATADKFARGGYPGPKPLPTKDNPWPEESATAESSRPLAAISAAVMDFRVLMADRVSTIEKWILTGEEPQKYRDQVEKERLDMINALEKGEITRETRANGRIAVVESTHRAALSVGYALAPVVVALNPSFKQGPGEAYRKFTICAFEPKKFVDITAALAELQTFEAGWGGSPTIGGSPQGVSSRLTVDQVVEVIKKHLK